MYGQGMGFSNWLGGYGGFMHGSFGMILTILFWVLLIGLAVKIFQYVVTSKKEETPPGAMTILKNRYAAGDITKEEFDQMKKDIA